MDSNYYSSDNNLNQGALRKKLESHSVLSCLDFVSETNSKRIEKHLINI